MKLFDAHCHMQDPELASNLTGVFSRARAAGVEKILCCGTSEDDWPRVTELCTRFGELVPSFGLHPWRVNSKSSSWMTTLAGLIVSDPAAVVGEIGLDHAIHDRNDTEQAEVFVTQLRLAKALERPASIHCRRAWDAILPAMEDLGGLPAGFMIHSYSGSAEMVAHLAEMGAYFSFSGSVTWHRNERAHQAVVAVPLDRLLIETDSPDIMPVAAAIATDSPPSTTRANEPCNLIHVLRKVAELRKMSEEKLAAITWENACRLLLLRP